MKISVVVPTCGRPRELARCVQAVQDADEIVVTSDDDLPPPSSVFGSCRIHWVKGPVRGPAANRNYGARVAAGDWIAFVDDDCVADEGWLAALRSAMDGADVVEGKTVCPDQTGHWLEDVVENVSGGEFWSCNLAVRRLAFEQLGGFDERFPIAGGEDLEFRSRIRKAGLRCRFEPRMVVYHFVRRLTLNQWFRRIFRQHWHLLYRLIVSDGKAGALAEVIDLIRVTKRTLLGWSARNLRRSLPRIVVTWLLLPVWTLYLLLWEWKFRKHYL
jgi:GT2 family glycosyltransferase